MDTLRIESKFNKTEFIAGNLIRWEVKWFKNRRQIINYLIASITILTLGIVVRTKDDPTNPFIYLGGVFLAFTALLLFLRLTSKNRFSKKISKIAEVFEAQQMDCVYEFSNDSVKYWDNQKHIDFKWEVFTSYYIFKDYLILNINDSLFESYIFKKGESEADRCSKVLEFVQSKLELKKLK